MSIFLFVDFLFLRIFFIVVFIIIVVVVSFVRDLDVELRFAIFALELIIIGNVEFACASWAERDFRLHAV